MHAAIAAAIVAIPIAIVALTTGLGHQWSEAIPGPPSAMLRGLFGLLLDGAAGMLFQAPIYVLGVIALARWRIMPAAFRLGIASSVLYLFYLVPRSEWHGGWSPRLVCPCRALNGGILPRIAPSPIVRRCLNVELVAHGMAVPWRLFTSRTARMPPAGAR
jgi:hypothetical protein